MANVLITGLDGFTGRYVAELLRERGHTVTGTVRRDPAGIPGGVQCELLDVAALQRLVDQVQPDWVVHLAAIAFVGHGNAGEMYSTNVLGTRNLLDCLTRTAKRPAAVLLASSANVYGNTASAGPITEQAAMNPANDYAVSKVAMEYMARLWNDKLPIVTVRPFNYIGVGQSLDFLAAKIADHFRRRAPAIELGNLDVARDFSDVRWVARSYCDLLEAAPAGEVFNICSGKATSLGELLDMMGKIAGYQIEVTVNPAFVRANEVKYLCGSNDKLLRAVGNRSVPSLEETVAWLVKGV